MMEPSWVIAKGERIEHTLRAEKIRRGAGEGEGLEVVARAV